MIDRGVKINNVLELGGDPEFEAKRFQRPDSGMYLNPQLIIVAHKF